MNQKVWNGQPFRHGLTRRSFKQWRYRPMLEAPDFRIKPRFDPSGMDRVFVDAASDNTMLALFPPAILDTRRRNAFGQLFGLGGSCRLHRIERRVAANVIDGLCD